MSVEENLKVIQTVDKAFNKRDWSAFDDVNISGSSGSRNIPRNWEDTWKFAAGVHFRPVDKWLLQLGFSYDTSPVDSDDRTPDMPIDRQIRFSIGALHEYSDNVRMAFAFEWVNLGDATLEKPAVQGDYSRNDIFFLSFNTNWKKLPWSDKGTSGSSAASDADES